ncbi:ankyrin, partial [Tuber magnatum]
MSFLHLPNEIILQISEELSLGDVCHLLQTNRRLASLLSPAIIERICRERSREWCAKALYSAAERKDKAAAALILEKTREVLNYTEDPTLLEELIKTQSETVFNTLLECWVEADIKYSPGLQTSLHLAAQHGRLATLRLLVARDDVDVNSVDCGGLPPLLSAIKFGQYEIVMVKMLLADPRVKVNLRDNKGRAPLHFATCEGLDDLVELLLGANDIDVNLQDHESKSPLLVAAIQGREAVTELLLADERVDVNSADSHGRTPLYFAALGGREEMVKLL